MRFVTYLRAQPLPWGCALVGVILGGGAGAITGLVVGLHVHAATAWFAVFELGVPAAVAGAAVGFFSVAPCRWRRPRRHGPTGGVRVQPRSARRLLSLRQLLSDLAEQGHLLAQRITAVRVDDAEVVDHGPGRRTAGRTFLLDLIVSSVVAPRAVGRTRRDRLVRIQEVGVEPLDLSLLLKLRVVANGFLEDRRSANCSRPRTTWPHPRNSVSPAITATSELFADEDATLAARRG